MGLAANLEIYAEARALELLNVGAGLLDLMPRSP